MAKFDAAAFVAFLLEKPAEFNHQVRSAWGVLACLLAIEHLFGFAVGEAFGAFDDGARRCDSS